MTTIFARAVPLRPCPHCYKGGMTLRLQDPREGNGVEWACANCSLTRPADVPKTGANRATTP